MTQVRWNTEPAPEPLAGFEQPATDGERRVPKSVVVAVVGPLVLAILYVSGLLTSGYDSKTIRFAGFARSAWGSSLGSKRLLLRAGQVLTVDYKVEAKQGGLYIRLWETWAKFGTAPTEQVHVRGSREGQLRVTIPSTGLYRLSIVGSPDGRGYDVTYRVRWRAS